MRSDPTAIHIDDKPDLNMTTTDNESTTGISHNEGLQLFQNMTQGSAAHIQPRIQPTENQNTANEDITPESLLRVISQEWISEMERIKSLGLNGYKRRKESRSECLV